MDKKLLYILIPIVLNIIGFLIIDHFNMKERISSIEGRLEGLSYIQTNVL